VRSHNPGEDAVLSRKLKAAYFAVMRYPMRANALRHRILSASPAICRVQLGPGQQNYLDGWVNVDANFVSARIDVWADIGATLPFRSGTVDAFYSHHVIEHLPDAVLPHHLAELFRCLKPGGAIRVGGPNGDTAFERFIAKDADWFDDFPDKRTSVGGRLANFILCRGEHLSILTSSYLEELATGAGFNDIRFMKPRMETGFPSLFDEQVLSREFEPTPETPHTLLMEALKPKL
jgi:predicted SAM-dependent methyltransferase